MTRTNVRPAPMSDLDAEIGFRIRQARQKKGLSQKDLAAHLGISFQQLYKYEQGINRISPVRLAILSDVLGLEPNDLFGTTVQAPQIETKDVPLASMDQRAYDLWHRIEDAHSKRVILALMQVVSKTYFSDQESR